MHSNHYISAKKQVVNMTQTTKGQNILNQCVTIWGNRRIQKPVRLIKRPPFELHPKSWTQKPIERVQFHYEQA